MFMGAHKVIKKNKKLLSTLGGLYLLGLILMLPVELLRFTIPTYVLVGVFMFGCLLLWLNYFDLEEKKTLVAVVDWFCKHCCCG